MECKIRDVEINYEIKGEGIPIVMIHGYYSDSRVMQGCMEPIFSNTTGYKRIYIDLPGMGKSQSAAWINSSDCMLEIVIELIDKILPEEKFIIAGNSYGGYIARGVIYKMVHRILGALLICPISIPEYGKRNLAEHQVLLKDESLLAKLSQEDEEDFQASMVLQSGRIYERYKKEIIEPAKKANHEFLQNIMKQGYAFSFNIDKKFDKPALILLGRQDDCVGYKDAWKLLEFFSRASFCILDCAGHNLQIEQEDTFNSLVSEWLTRIAF